MDITVNELMINFNNYLKSSWVYLKNIGVVRETLDDWDDWVELSYDVFVLRKIAECFGVHINSGYGFESMKDMYIEVSIAPNKDFLAATDAEHVKDTEPIHFSKEIVKDSNVTFSFVDFNHPFVNEDDILAFDYVHGSIIEAGYFPVGTIICAPLESCTFQLSSLAQP